MKATAKASAAEALPPGASGQILTKVKSEIGQGLLDMWVPI